MHECLEQCFGVDMNERLNVSREIDEEELVCVGEIDIMERLHRHAREVLKRDESSGVSCRYPDYVGFLCEHVGAREDITVNKVYRSLVKVGYGIRYAAYKNGDTTMSRIADMIKSMRATGNLEDMVLAKVVDDAISFSGKNRVFRYDINFIAQMSNYAKELNINVNDLYLFYCLVGLDAVGDLDEYEHIKSNVLFIKASYELGKAEANLKYVNAFMERFKK